MAGSRMRDCYGKKADNRRDVGEIDGTYAWIIALASFFGHVIIYGIIWSSGVFFDLFNDIFDVRTWMIALIATISTACTFGFCPITGLLINRFGHRLMTILGGLVAGAGLVLSSYATDVYFLLATFGVLTGTGFGMAYLGLISIVPLYFERWRTVALGIAVSGVGIGTFVYPPLLRFLVFNFGVRGSLLVTGGVTFNLCLCGMFMRHPRTPAKVMVKTISMDGPSDEDWSSYSAENSDSYMSQIKSQMIHSHIIMKKKTCCELLNLQIFSNYSYIALCINNFLALFGLGIFYVHIVAYAETKHISPDNAALLVSILGISNFMGRIIFGLLGKISCYNVLISYMTCFTLCGCVILLLPFTNSFIQVAVIAALFGFLSACIGPYLPVLITEFLSLALIPSGYGYLLVFEALGSLLGPPAGGFIYDRFQIYEAAFYLSGAMVIASGLVMLVPIIGRCISPKSSLDILTDIDCSHQEKPQHV